MGEPIEGRGVGVCSVCVCGGGGIAWNSISLYNWSSFGPFRNKNVIFDV